MARTPQSVARSPQHSSQQPAIVARKYECGPQPAARNLSVARSPQFSPQSMYPQPAARNEPAICECNVLATRSPQLAI